MERGRIELWESKVRTRAHYSITPLPHHSTVSASVATFGLMKRSPELRDLSEQHHYALVAARRLRLAAEGRGELSGALREFLHVWEAEIQPHFRSEEAVLLPVFAEAVGDDAPLIVRTMVEHVRLRRLVRALSGAGESALAERAEEVARALHDHVRFEERELFPAIEAACAGEALKQLGEELQSPSGPRCRVDRP